MAQPTIVTRAGKGSALTWVEGDANFTNLQAASIPTGGLAGEYLVKNTSTDYDLAWTDRVNAKTIYETVKNVSGGSLSKGTPVYQVGVSGNTVTVAAARADDPNKLAIGVLNETIADEAEGQMIILGEIKGVNTASFSTGDKVYLGSTGGYTNVAPNTSGVAVQFLGVVFRVHASNGSGYITGTLSEDFVKYNGSGFELWDGDSWVVLTTEIRGSISVSDAGGDGSLSYNSTNGTITYTGPGVSDYRAAFTAGTNITITDGVIAATGGGGYPQITNDTSTNATRYVLFDDVTTGDASSIGTSSTKLTFNPSTGTLTATIITGTFKGYNEGAIYDLGTTGGTIAPDVANGNVQKITLNSALTMNAFTNPVAGQSLTLIIYGGTSYTSITSTMKFAGGSKALTGTANCIDIMTVYYDGTNYFASIGKGFA